MMIHRTAACLFTAMTMSFAVGVKAQTLSPPAGLDDAAVQSTRAMANELLTIYQGVSSLDHMVMHDPQSRSQNRLYNVSFGFKEYNCMSILQ